MEGELYQVYQIATTEIVTGEITDRLVPHVPRVSRLINGLSVLNGNSTDVTRNALSAV